MIEVEEKMQLSSVFRCLRVAWALWPVALLFTLMIFFSVLSATNGLFAVEIAVLLVVGLAGGGLIRIFVRLC